MQHEPGALSGIVGQPRAVRILSAASRGPAGSYLLTGPAGVGKRQAALALAAATICPDGCGACGICDRVMRGLHPDVAVYAPEGYTFPVETIREVVASAAQSPMEADRRVIILEEADRIIERSQNALLKALEEPHPRLVWVLVADSIDAFLPTVVSRCQVVNFVQVASEDLASALVDAGIPSSETEWIVRSARGNVALARRLATDPVTRAVRTAAIQIATSPLTGDGALDHIDRVASLAAEAKSAAEQAQAAELAAYDSSAGTGRGTAAMRKRITDRHKRELRRVETEVYNDLCSWLGLTYRDLAACAAGGSDALVQTDAASQISDASRRLPPAAWLALAEAAIEAKTSIRDNANAAMTVEHLVLKQARTGVGVG